MNWAQLRARCASPSRSQVCVADVSEARAGPNDRDAAPHAFVSDFTQAARLHGRKAGIEHAARVAVEAVLDDRDVDVDDVSRLEQLVAGDAVADEVIDRGAHRFRIR